MTQSSHYFSEASVENAMPIWLVDFVATGFAWYYARAPYDIKLDHTYLAQPGLQFGKIEQTLNDRRSQVAITLPLSATIVQQLLNDPPEAQTKVTIRRLHVDRSFFYQTMQAGTFGSGIFGGHTPAQLFSGWLFGHELKLLPSARAAELTATPWRSDLGLAGSAQRTGKNCQTYLGSPLCGVDLDSYRASGVVSAVDGTTVTATFLSGQADGYWTNGTLTCGGRSRKILAHSGSTVEISTALSTLAVGASIAVTPGCDQVWEGDCVTHYSNGDNFRGQPHREVNIHTQGVL